MATTIATIDTQHADMIHDAQLDYYGRKLATCSSDRTIKVYDVSGDETAQSAELGGHEGPVWQVAWAHPQFGALLASCGYDRRVLVQREVAPGQWSRILSWEEHASSVNSVVWAPHEYGLQLAAASSDGRVSVLTHRDDDSWTSAFIDDVCPLGVNAVSWAPAGHIGGRDASAQAQQASGAASAAAPFTKRLATGGCDGVVRLFRSAPTGGAAGPAGPEAWVADGALNARGQLHKEWVRDVAWSPASGLGINCLASASDDGVVVVWRQATPSGEWAAEALPPFPAPVWRVSWSVTGNLLAVSCGDNSVTLWRESLGGQWQQVSSVPDPTVTAAPPRQGGQQQMGY